MKIMIGISSIFRQIYKQSVYARLLYKATRIAWFVIRNYLLKRNNNNNVLQEISTRFTNITWRLTIDSPLCNG